MTDLSMNNKKARNLALFVGCVLFWIILDRITKVYIDTNYKTGDVIVQNILNLFQFDLVHNRGAAWGSFSGTTPILAGIAIVVCAIVCVFAWRESMMANGFEMVGLGLLVAGGIGNCIDRLVYGYVVDFITPTFINFPTFNIADIGVTCGIVLAAIGYLYQLKNAKPPLKDE